MKSAAVRAALEAIPTDADFEAFCIDSFPATQRKFSAGMDRTQRINLLLAEHGPSALASTQLRLHAAALERPRLFYVPHPLSQNFTGRDATLKTLRQQLVARRQVALWGLGGSGKTQTAVAYAHRHRAEYPVVLWLAADSPASFEQGLIDLGAELLHAGFFAATFVDEGDPQTVRRAVLSYLQRAEDYLLICCHADSPLELRGIWPQQLGGHVLFTSRSQDIRRLGAALVELEKLSFEESRLYLEHRHPAYDDAEQRALTELAQELDGMPLALAQAAAFLIEHQSRYADYLRAYRQQSFGLLEQALPENCPTSVSAIWTMSIAQVAESSAASLELLKLCAMCAASAIPEELFAQPAAHEGGEVDALALDRLLKPLLGHALVHRQREERLLSLHRLIAQALLQQMPDDEQRRWADAAVAQLNRAFPRVALANWPQCRRLSPQLPLMHQHIVRWNLNTPESVRLLTQGGYFLRRQGRYADAEILLRTALALQEQRLGSEHLETAANLEHLGFLLRNMKRLDEAAPLLRRALAIREKAVGPTHADITKSLCGLGRVLQARGDLAEAEQMLRRALAIRQATPGFIAADIARNTSYLATVLRDQGRMDEAQPLYQQALLILEKDLGVSHPDLAYVLDNLSVLCERQGQRDEAESLLRRALQIREQTLPDSHPLTLGLRERLGAMART